MCIEVLQYYSTTVLQYYSGTKVYWGAEVVQEYTGTGVIPGYRSSTGLYRYRSITVV